MEARQPVRSGRDVEAVVGKRPLEQLRHLGRVLRRGVDQEETVAFLARKRAHEILFRDKEFALEDAVAKSADHAQLHVAGCEHFA